MQRPPRNQRTVPNKAQYDLPTMPNQGGAEETVRSNPVPYAPAPAQRPQPATRKVNPQPVPQPAPHYGPAQPHAPAPPQRQHLPAAHPAPRRNNRTLLYAIIAVVVLLFSMLGAVGLGIGLVYANGILPGVSASGVALGGMSQQAAANTLHARWNSITLRDGSRTWAANPDDLGITLDADRTAAAAYAQGRGSGSMFAAILGQVSVTPVISIDPQRLAVGLENLQDQLDLAPVNAGISLNNGQAQTTPPQTGRALDIAATVARAQTGTLAGGVLDLVMVDVQPAITDATPILAQAQMLLASPLTFNVYDPITGDSVNWTLPPDAWASWLTAAANPTSPTGMTLSVNPVPVQDFLTAQSAVFDASRYIKVDEGVAAVQHAVAAGQTSAFLRVYHHPTQHIVQAGESFATMGYDFGIPYPWIQQANPGVTDLSVGQSITIPSPDEMLPLPVVPGKRIIVSMSQQRVRVYENGALKWDWPASTGIASSPTAPGVFQIQSHETNAYAANWNLWMPNFMGVYRPVPTSDFMNGFHGFPTRGGSQLLWTNSLGTRVTYGCILISNDNSMLLYNWAEDGVVVEIQR